MANKYLIEKYDKFLDKTETTMKDWYRVGACCINLKACLRHVSMPGSECLLLDLDYDGYDWLFLRSGNLTININNVENIVLEPHESYTDTYTTSHCQCVESDWYMLDQELLKKICDAQSLEFKIAGATTYDIADGKRFIKYAQQFYNGFYDENEYKDVVEEDISEPMDSQPKDQSKVKSSRGCIFMLLIVFLSLFFVCI